MYHTGEEYTDLLTGLRTVDECITFFQLGSGDRLGHASPIFENVKDWYNSRKNRVTISKEDYIDNIAWLYCNAPLEVQKGKTGKILLINFKKQFEDLYREAFSQRLLSILNPNKELCIDLDRVSISHYFQAWHLRNMKPEEIKMAIQKNSCKGSEIAYYIAYCYFYISSVRNKGHNNMDLYLTNDQVELISKMQMRVLKKIKVKNISIEVCPSSNILLGTTKNGYCHPVINQFENLTNQHYTTDIRISINTDDQGIFSTSLMSEYSLIVNALEREISSKEEKENLYKWINVLRQNSIAMSN